jgi:predicted DNA-binding protein
MKQTIPFRAEPDTNAKLEQLAKERGLTKSEIIREAVQLYLSQAKSSGETKTTCFVGGKPVEITVTVKEL